MTLEARHIDLPVELAQQILQLCDPASWTTLMLLSKSWREFIEAERYGAIHVVLDSPSSRLCGVLRQRQLFRTLEQTPRLARRVQSLTVEMRINTKSLLPKCQGHGPFDLESCEEVKRRISTSAATRDWITRKSLTWAKLIYRRPMTPYDYSDSILRKLATQIIPDCSIDFDMNTQVIIAALTLALKNCPNLQRLDLRDQWSSHLLYARALLVATGSSRNLRYLTISQSLVATQWFAPTPSGRDSLPQALAGSLSHNQPEATSAVAVAVSASGFQAEYSGKLLVIYGTAGWTPLELARLNWLSAQGIPVITRQGTYGFHLYASHFQNETRYSFERYTGDIAGYITSFLCERGTSWTYNFGWHVHPRQIVVSILARQLDPHLGAIIAATSPLKHSVKYLKLIFCTPDDSDGNGEPPQISATRLTEMLSPLQRLEKITLWNKALSKADHAIRASRKDVLAAARANGMDQLEEIVFFGEPWLFGSRYSV